MAALFLGAVSCARLETDARTARSAAPVINAARSANAAVVAVVNPQELCTGYLIAPNLVLTARHCVSTVGGPGTTTLCSAVAGTDGGTLQPATPVMDFTPAQISVFTSARLPFSTTGGLPVAEVIVLPDSQRQPLCGRDVALLRLAAPIEGAVVIAPRLDGPPVVGEALTVVGYGQTGGGDPNSAGTRMEASGSSPEAIGVTLDANGATRTVEAEWVIDQGPCSGDSGSPAIDANGRSVGVMSRGRGAVCVSMVYERVDVHSAWLRDTTLAAAMAAGIAPPEWAAPGDGDAGRAGDSGSGNDAPGDGGGGAMRGGCDAGRSRGATHGGGLLLAAAALARARRRRGGA